MTRIPLSALIGLIATSVFFLAALFAQFIAPYGMADVVGDSWEPASSKFLLGTDSIGRDLLSRMIYGGRTTIFVATATTAVSFITGSVLGFAHPVKVAAIRTSTSHRIMGYHPWSGGNRPRRETAGCRGGRMPASRQHGG